MNITRHQLKVQFERAKRLGWIPYFEDAAKLTKGCFDTADLMAIGSRETNLDPKWTTKAGDGGFGYGLMQADLRSFPDWIKTGKWKDPREGIIKGAEVLMSKWNDTIKGIGVKRGVTSSKTQKISYFIGKEVQGAEAQRVAIAAYNCGRWAHYAVTNGKDADTYTTGKDYSADVLGRSRIFRELLAEQTSAAAPPVQPPTPPDAKELTSEPQLPATPPPTTSETVTVVKERTPIYVKIGAAVTALTGMGINVGTVIQSKLEAITPLQTLFVVIGLALVGIALLVYDHSAKRAHEKTLAKMKSAADPSSNTVELSR